MLTCGGFDMSVGGECSLAWIGAVLAVFVIMVARKYLFELVLNQDLGPVEFMISIAATVITYFIVIGLSGAYKWATLAALIVGLAAAYFAPMLIGGSSGGDSSGGGSSNF